MPILIRLQILALSKFHGLGYVHLDIKPDNILVSPAGHLALADFGLSEKVVDGKTVCKGLGTVGYGAPELIADGLFGESSISQKADVWSMAVVIIGMFKARATSPYWDLGSMRLAELNAYANDEISSNLTFLQTLTLDPMLLPDMVWFKNHVPDLHKLLSKVSPRAAY